MPLTERTTITWDIEKGHLTIHLTSWQHRVLVWTFNSTYIKKHIKVNINAVFSTDDSMISTTATQWEHVTEGQIADHKLKLP